MVIDFQILTSCLAIIIFLSYNTPIFVLFKRIYVTANEPTTHKVVAEINGRKDLQDSPCIMIALQAVYYDKSIPEEEVSKLKKSVLKIFFRQVKICFDSST